MANSIQDYNDVFGEASRDQKETATCRQGPAYKTFRSTLLVPHAANETIKLGNLFDDGTNEYIGVKILARPTSDYFVQIEFRIQYHWLSADLDPITSKPTKQNMMSGFFLSSANFNPSLHFKMQRVIEMSEERILELKTRLNAPDDWWTKHHQSLHFLTFTFDRAAVRHAYNINSERSPDPHKAAHNALKTWYISTDDISLAAVIKDDSKAGTLSATFNSVRNQISTQIATDPLLKWTNPSRHTWSRRKTPSVRLMRGSTVTPRESRPNVRYAAFPSFASMDHYNVLVGHATIQDDEDFAARVRWETIQCRLFRINGYGDRKLLALLQSPHNPQEAQLGHRPIQLSKGDQIEVDLARSGSPRITKNIFTGEIIHKIRYQAPNEVAAILHAPRDDDGKFTTYGHLKTIDMKDIDESQNTIAYPRPSDYSHAEIRLNYNNKPLGRGLASLMHIYDKQLERPVRLLLGNDLSLHRQDKALFDNIAVPEGTDKAAFITNIARSHGLKDDLGVLLRGIDPSPANLTIIEGAPTTGKSFLCKIAALIHVIGNSKVLVVAPTNVAADDFAESLNGMIQAAYKGTVKAPIVVRMHPMKSERSVAWREAEVRRPHDREQAYQAADDTPMTSQVARELHQEVSSALRQTHPGVIDSRVSVLNLSLGYWVGMVSGLTDPESPYVDDCMESAVFRHLFENHAQGDDDTAFEKSDFARSTNQVQDNVMSKASVVVTTNFGASEQPVATNFHPNLVIFEDAAKTAEPEIWNILCNNPNAFFLSAGNSRQLRPTVRSRKTNPLAAQLSVSFHARMALCGAQSTLLSIQHRDGDSK